MAKIAKTVAFLMSNYSPGLVTVMLATALSMGMTSGLIHHSPVGEHSFAGGFSCRALVALRMSLALASPTPTH